MTSLSTLDELALLQHFKEVHGVELELGELRSLQAYLYETSQGLVF
jgi:hypothetical protein